MKLSKRSIFIIVLIIINFVIDQVSKKWVEANVDMGDNSSIIGDIFTLHHVKNTGAFLGMGSELNDTLRLILLLILPIVVLGAVLRHIFKDKNMDQMSLIAFCCIIGGGFANVYDRILYGKVTDFLHLDFGGVFRTGIFNLADVSVSAGMIMLLVAGVKQYLKEKKQKSLD
ncbi:signal peptidase II [Pontimicrobium sp. IMCC45349]|uniref:signal peptidase II n=1 Tax=Pontimicrobium sp. IMCC45349 TaxID=3391574 RepID=UPI00399EEFCB